VNVGSLFSGIGGFDLAARWMGWRTVWHSEIDEYACKVFAQRFPESRNVGDVRRWVPQDGHRVDVITGGFPCQDISSARTRNERQGLAGPESGLWHDMLRVVAQLKPRYVVVENVARWRTWVPFVRLGLHKIGYTSVPVQLWASDFGAPFQGARVFVAATYGGSEPVVTLNAEVAELPQPTTIGGTHWRCAPSRALGMADGIPYRMDRLRCCGNAVMPQMAYWLFQQIEARERAA
jgi:DNA (cytosine-5)-methyltransferase 1